MSKRRNHHKQASRAGKVIAVASPLLAKLTLASERRNVPVIVKRSLAELRKIAEEEEQARWEELQLVHEISRWL